jgi:hypothetical protein
MIEASTFLELSLWCCVTSAQTDVLTTALQCIRLFSVVESHSAFPRPPHFSEVDMSTRAALLQSFAEPRMVIGGRLAMQKQIRRKVAAAPGPSPLHVMGFHWGMSRFLELTSRINYSGQTQRSDPSNASNDQFYEWQNLLFLLTSSARSWLDEEMVVYPDYIISLLPSQLQNKPRRPGIVTEFIGEVVRLLWSDNLSIRQSARDAICNELSLALAPTMFTYLAK